MTHSFVYMETLLIISMDRAIIHPSITTCIFRVALMGGGANPRSTCRQTISHTFTPLEAEGLGDSWRTWRLYTERPGGQTRTFCAERANSIIFNFLHWACCWNPGVSLWSVITNHFSTFEKDRMKGRNFNPLYAVVNLRPAPLDYYCNCLGSDSLQKHVRLLYC